MLQILSHSHEPRPKSTQPASPAPFLIQFFLVQGPGYRCVAYCDSDGRWRNAFNNEELFGDISIID